MANLLFHMYIPATHNIFVAYRRNWTRVSFRILIGTFANTYRGDIAAIHCVVFRLDGRIFFFHIFLMGWRFKRVAFQKTIFFCKGIIFQIARGHLVPKHSALISLKRAHDFAAIFIPHNCKKLAHARYVITTWRTDLELKALGNLLSDVFMFAGYVVGANEEESSTNVPTGLPFPEVLGMRSGCNAMFASTGCFHDSTERNDPPTASGRVAGERPYGDRRNPISRLMMSAPSRDTRYSLVGPNFQHGLEIVHTNRSRSNYSITRSRLLFHSIFADQDDIYGQFNYNCSCCSWLFSRT